MLPYQVIKKQKQKKLTDHLGKSKDGKHDQNLISLFYLCYKKKDQNLQTLGQIQDINEINNVLIFSYST